MIGDASGQRRGGPATGVGQPRMGWAEILDRPSKIHALRQCQRAARQRAPSACQRGQTRTAGRVQSCDGCRLDDAVARRPPPARLHACRCAIDQAACGRDHPSPRGARDDLRDQARAPRTQPGPSALPRVRGLATGLPDGPHVSHHAIGTDQQGTTGCTALHPLDPPSEQGPVLFACTQPSMGSQLPVVQTLPSSQLTSR